MPRSQAAAWPAGHGQAGRDPAAASARGPVNGDSLAGTRPRAGHLPHSAGDRIVPVPAPRIRITRQSLRRLPVTGRCQTTVLAATVIPLALTTILIPFRASVPGTDVALALILVIAVAARGQRPAGAASTASAAACFGVFLTLPGERLASTSRTGIPALVLLLAAGLAVTGIAAWGHRQHAAASRLARYLDSISAAARAAATGDCAATLTRQVCEQLTRLLPVSDCRFQTGTAGIGNPARLLRDGSVQFAGRVLNTERDSLPPGTSIELLAEAGGLLQGRFLLTPAPGAHLSREHLLVSAALADQAGAALSNTRAARPHV